MGQTVRGLVRPALVGTLLAGTLLAGTIACGGGTLNQVKFVPPFAAAGANQTVVLGTAVLLDGSESHAVEGSIATWNWDLGDGASATTEATQHTYQAAGDFHVQLRITDSHGLSASAAATVTVLSSSPASSPPVPIISGPTMVQASTMFTLDGSGSTDPNPGGRIVGWSWNLGDGTTLTGASVMHQYAAAGAESVTLTVTDALGLSATSAPWPIAVGIPGTPVFPSQWSYGQSPMGQATACGTFVAGPLTIDIPNFSTTPGSITVTEGGGLGSTLYTGAYTPATRGFSASNTDSFGDVQTLSGTFSADFKQFDGTYKIVSGLLSCTESLTIHGVRTSP